jgi:hypothetical protein
MKADFILNSRHFISGVVIREEFEIAPNTFYVLRRRGLIPQGIKIGRTRYYDRAEFEHLMSQGEEIKQRKQKQRAAKIVDAAQ